jgi:hypothetical protein
MLVWTRKSGQSVTVSIDGGSVEIVAMISPLGVHYLTTTNRRGFLGVEQESLDRIAVEHDSRRVVISTRKRSDSCSAVTFDDDNRSFSIRPTERLNDAKALAKGYTHQLTIPGIEPLYVKSIQHGSELLRTNYPGVEGFSFRRIANKTY